MVPWALRNLFLGWDGIWSKYWSSHEHEHNPHISLPDIISYFICLQSFGLWFYISWLALSCVTLGFLKDEERWGGVGAGDHVTEQVRELGRSKWSDDFDEDDGDRTHGAKGNPNSLSGLIQAYGKDGKSVQWGDQVCMSYLVITLYLYMYIWSVWLLHSKAVRIWDFLWYMIDLSLICLNIFDTIPYKEIILLKKKYASSSFVFFYGKYINCHFQNSITWLVFCHERSLYTV